MHQYVANRNIFRDCPKLFPPITGFHKLCGRNTRLTDQPHRKPVGRSWAGGAVRPRAVGWQIADVAVMRDLRLVGTIPQNTEALDRADSWTPWRWVCKRLAQEHPANVAWYGRRSNALTSASDLPMCTIKFCSLRPTHRLIKTMSRLAVINKIHSCWHFVIRLCDTQRPPLSVINLLDAQHSLTVIDHKDRYWSKIRIFA